MAEWKSLLGKIRGVGAGNLPRISYGMDQKVVLTDDALTAGPGPKYDLVLCRKRSESLSFLRPWELSLPDVPLPKKIPTLLRELLRLPQNTTKVEHFSEKAIRRFTEVKNISISVQQLRIKSGSCHRVGYLLQTRVLRWVPSFPIKCSKGFIPH